MLHLLGACCANFANNIMNMLFKWEIRCDYLYSVKAAQLGNINNIAWMETAVGVIRLIRLVSQIFCAKEIFTFVV